MSKDHVRREMRMALSALTPDQRRRQSAAIGDALAAIAEFRDADVLFLYVAIGQEVETAAIAGRAWQEGKTVAVPRVCWTTRTMQAVVCESFEAGLAVGRYGLLEPVSGEPIEPGRLDLIVVPGLAFDRQGRRLGRGGGFYDRFLSQPGLTATRAGIAFRQQVLDELPVDDRDEPVDLLVTDAEVLRFQRSDLQSAKE